MFFFCQGNWNQVDLSFQFPVRFVVAGGYVQLWLPVQLFGVSSGFQTFSVCSTLHFDWHVQAVSKFCCVCLRVGSYKGGPVPINANALLVFWCPQEISAFIKNFVLHLFSHTLSIHCLGYVFGICCRNGLKPNQNNQEKAIQIEFTFKFIWHVIVFCQSAVDKKSSL